MRSNFLQERDVVLGENFFNLVVVVLGVLVVFNTNAGDLKSIEDGVEQTEQAAAADDQK